MGDNKESNDVSANQIGQINKSNNASVNKIGDINVEILDESDDDMDDCIQEDDQKKDLSPVLEL